MIAITSVAFSLTSPYFIAAEITLFIWAVATFAAVPALQVGVVHFGKDAPNLVSTINIGAFNTGNALGAWAGGMAIEQGFEMTHVPLVAALMALIGLVVTAFTYLSAKGKAAMPSPAE
jgi:DHA1 family inner membrane transport protein